MMRSSRRRAGAYALAGTLTMLVVLGGWSLAAAGPPSAVDTPAPTVLLHCEMDLCVAEASYAAPAGAGHEVAFLWQTSAAPGLPDNRADTLRRPHPVAPSQQLADGHRHHATDVVWHSDIRCDDTVTVTVTGEGFAPATRTVTKPVPGDPVEAFCSAYGMPGAIR